MRNQKVMRKNNEILTIGMDYVRESRVNAGDGDEGIRIPDK